MSSDNISGIKSGGIIKTLFLLPGRIVQWFMYITIGSAKGYGKVREQTRMARSPILTYFYSFLFWASLILFILYEKQMLPPEFYQ